MRGPFLSLILPLLLLVACKPADQPPPREAARVGAAVVATGPAQPPVLTNGIVTTREELKLSFKIAGIVRKIAVDEGQLVGSGQQLAELELTEVESQVEQARQLADKAGRDLARGGRLRADGVIGEQELETLRTQTAVAQATLRSAEFNQKFSTILAPRDGVVLRKLVEEREFVQPGQTILVVGPKDGGYILRAGLSDRDIVRLRLGDPATVAIDAFPGQAFSGRITVLAAAADTANGLFQIEVELAAAPVKLVSGLAARLQIDPAAAEESTLPYAPIAAVIEADGDRAAVFVVEGGIARRRPVRIAFISPTAIAVSDGLKAGETVVTDGALYLEDGEKIQVVAPASAARQ